MMSQIDSLAILKMATGRNCSMSGINSGHHYLPMISDNVEYLWYCGRHFENGDREKFFNVGNQFGTSHNTAQNQPCPISPPFHMWVDYDAPK
jgi:hypothetical protein